ncbi:DUF998 domain-containing protein [Salinibaculum rarum]|uniref:DUF998 domain-containing protein n=1 Tax=Salinibaculum rarum TaxID=3058903 RepID=UPI0026603705|nr:DUF998 domain-containing protein [Salinibaculum sp. KK48]
MDSGNSALRGAGLVAVVLTMGTILVATVVSPAFAWRQNALSNLGVVETAAGTGLTVVLFNGGLILGGVVGLAFAVALTRSAQSLAGRATALSFGLTVVFMALVGVFPQDTAPHFPVALGFYLLVSVTLWLDGLTALGTHWRQRGLVAITFGTGNLVGWLVWGLTGSPTRAGLAIPELWGALLFSVWTGWVSVGLVRGRWSGTGHAGAGL